MTTAVIYVVLGVAFLFIGGESLIRGASSFASSIGLRPIFIGLTIVAFGTSMPEVLVSVLAVLQSKPDIALSNAIGSNIFNFTVILGLSALIHPLKVQEDSIKREVPFLVFSSILIWFLGKNGIISRLEGALCLLFFACFLWMCFRNALKEMSESVRSMKGQRTQHILWMMLGFLLLALGAQSLVKGSVEISRMLGVSELVIGLTIIAAGTSLPELATSIMASIRKQDDIAVGNVTGSHIFNIFFILGLTSLVTPLHINASLLSRDIPFMVGISLISLPILKTGFRISRWEGCLLLLIYGIYCFLLIY